jgi:RimJ/RimL family protein N-acetyltransferase
MSHARLLNVYRTPGAVEILRKLLAERSPEINISHRKMPTLTQHQKFVRSRPYKGWYLVSVSSATGSVVLGSIYLSKLNEIGVFIFKKYQGANYENEAVRCLMRKYKKVDRFLANVSSRNKRGIRFFRALKFRHIQNTYEFRR